MTELTEEKLKEILQQHYTWVNSAGDKGCAADMSQVNLRGADLHEADLPVARLCYSDLTAANLHGANLSSANLFKANLSFADLSNSDLGFTILHEADLYFSKFYNSKSLSYAQLINSKNFDKAFFTPQQENEFCLAGKKRFDKDDLISLQQYKNILSEKEFNELIEYVKERMN